MNKRELNHKAFDARKYDIYKYFLVFFSEYDVNIDKKLSFEYIFNSSDNEKYRELLCIPYDFDSWDELVKIEYLMKQINSYLNFGNREPIYIHDMLPLKLLKYAKEKNIRLNCINHAIIFNAILLSFSIYSRCLWCMPMDISNLEFHVVNIAYVRKLQKWVFLDVSKNIICYKERIPLGPAEIRKSLVDNEKIEFNYLVEPWNAKVQNEYYKIYLTKNMFRFGAFAFNSASSNMEHYIYFNELNPKKYYPNHGVTKMVIGESVCIINYTCCEEQFWKAPEEVTRDRGK